MKVKGGIEMNDIYIISIFVCLVIAIILDHYNLTKHLREHSKREYKVDKFKGILKEQDGGRK